MNSIKNKVVLCTGGTGSFGNAVVAKLIPFNPKKVIIFSRDELKQEDMRNKYQSKLLHFVIGDIRDRDAVDQAMVGVDYVFHAAALKQVPAYEINPLEAVKTNILGSNNVMESAIKNKVKRVVVLTTDKAVYPINAMGMSKALMEKLMIAHSKTSKTVFCGVRYGNVMYSRGSVIPYFVSLIKQSKSLQITNLDMTRFLITLDDAVNLVLEALVKGKNGQIYIRKSPACTIYTLAEALSQLFNYKTRMTVVGARVGEKIHETLEEGFTSDNARQLNVNQVKKLLMTLPEIRKELSLVK